MSLKPFTFIRPKEKITDAVRKKIAAVGKFLSQLQTKFTRSKFESPEFNFFTIRNALNEESLFRRAVDKYQEQIWKNEWKFVGKNQETLKWIRQRFREMEVVTGTSTQELLERISRQLITFSNCVLVKVRNKNSTSGKPYHSFDGRLMQPVAGYFVLPMEYVQLNRNEAGTVIKYRLGSDVEKEWALEDIIHIVVHKHEGYAFGTPMIVPVMDDILALRQIEENLQILVYQHAIPLYHFAIGTEQSEGISDEIDDLNIQLEQMPTYGSITTTNRVKIDVIGTRQESMDLVPVLGYWRERVLGGLGLTGVSFGSPNTANRGTATTVVAEFQMTTAMFQRAIKQAVDFFMIRDLLEEGGWTYLKLKDKDRVELYIPEVDFDAQIKREIHEIYKYEHNSVTEQEMRRGLGIDPIPDSDRHSMYTWLVKIPLAMVGKAPGIGTPATNNLESPSNQHQTKATKTKPVNQ